MEEKYKKDVVKLKEFQSALIKNNARQLELLREMIKLEFDVRHQVDYVGGVILYDLQKDIEDGIALNFSLENMLNNRQSIDSIERISKILDCLYDMTSDIHEKLNKYSIFE